MEKSVQEGKESELPEGYTIEIYFCLATRILINKKSGCIGLNMKSPPPLTQIHILGLGWHLMGFGDVIGF
jgi:hypothetical protein